MQNRKPYTRPKKSRFPPPMAASPDGIVAVGAEPWPELLIDAYSHGIFPWPHPNLPLLWFSPDPRFVLVPGDAHLGRSLRKTLRATRYEIRVDTRFKDTMTGCQSAFRPGQRGTWITEAMMDGYTALHALGLAHSFETFLDGELVGGFYGVSLGGAFFGESMFATAPDASKVAFATFLAHAVRWDVRFVDCQSYTDHLARFGATGWPRADFLTALDAALDLPTREGRWHVELQPPEALTVLEGAGIR